MLDTLEVSFPFLSFPSTYTVTLACSGEGAGYFDIYEKGEQSWGLYVSGELATYPSPIQHFALSEK